ncbi:MAG TPA: trypsin-like peptidase domain-containing protein [Steroidobacteraceae bacterium]
MSCNSRTLLYGMLLAALLPPTALAGGAPKSSPASVHDAENAVVKVFATVRRPDLVRPWTKEAPVEVSGSGVIIESKRILTNAHVVAYASQIQIQANQAGDKLPASVAAVAPGIDLAVLKLEDESFFATHAPLPRASALPHIKDAVLVYGFPAGGTSLSITKGIVSRIEFVPYQLGTSGLRIQIDAPINPGNSGGPAIAADKMIGLAFSHLKNSENIGYIIPNEEIELFLKEIAAGPYEGKPAMFGEVQTLENPALRAFLRLDGPVQGIVVRRMYEKNAAEVLQQWDVITKIGDTPVDDQGMVKVGSDLRLFFTYLVQKTARNGTVPLTVVRASKTLHVELPVPAHHPLLLDSLRGDYPHYFIYGPLVFSTASQEFLGSARARELAPALLQVGSPLFARLGEPSQPDRPELVLIPSPLFPHRISKGYSDPSGAVIKSVNDTPVRSLAHLVAVLRDLKDEFVRFAFDGRAGEVLVFRRADMLTATEEILTDNGVRAQGSPELLKIWQGH